jgi:RimJ/RimL family protein N-acetyltransferase
MISIRPAVAGDAQYIGAVFDAAVREGWALRSAGCREAFLYTHEKNQRALTLYEAGGYRRDGTVRESDFRGVHLREPRLVKSL